MCTLIENIAICCLRSFEVRILCEITTAQWLLIFTGSPGTDATTIQQITATDASVCSSDKAWQRGTSLHRAANLSCPVSSMVTAAHPHCSTSLQQLYNLSSTLPPLLYFSRYKRRPQVPSCLKRCDEAWR